jgi:predicted NAD/FAD-dependent oxidoreductase
VCQFDHGAQYFTIRDPFLRPYLESWRHDQHVAEWNGHMVSIEEFGKFRDVAPVQRFVGTPSMESLGNHLSRDLSVELESEVAIVVQESNAYRLMSKDERALGEFDVVLWNCPPAQVAKQLPVRCSWRQELSKVEMVPCWAVMLATERRWQVPFDGAFVNQGKLGWIARDSSKPSRSKQVETYVLHSTVAWAKENLELSKEQAIESLIEEAEKATGVAMPDRCIARSHRWLYSRPAVSLTQSSLWDDDRQLGACGDWCGGPRIEGALKSGMSLAGRVLSWLHEQTIATSGSNGSASSVIQLELF